MTTLVEPSAELERLYDQAMTRSGLPYRTPTHRMAEQLVATGEAAAYAKALALVTGDAKWTSRAAERSRNARDRAHISQADIDSAEHAESRARRFGMPY